MKKSIFLFFVLFTVLQINAQEFLNYNNLCLAKMDSVQLFTAWSRPRSLDFNNDGKTDFAVIDKNFDTLQVFFNNGAANFTTLTPLKIFIGTSAKDLCVGDFDNDSYTDIATINYLGDLTVFKNLSGTSISNVITYTNTINPNLEVELIECGDLNNDSKPDIIGTGKDFSTILMQAFTFQNNGSFNFGAISPFPIFISHTLINNTPYSPVAIADFNNDGFKDFVVGTNDNTDTLEVYPNLGLAAISFSSPTVYKEPLGSYVESLAARDYDGDGKPDVAIQAGAGFSINQNLGSFGFSSLYSSTSISGKNFEFKDVDSDLFPDLVIADWSGTFYVHRGTTSKGYPFGMNTSFSVGESYRFLLEEFDGNGIPDFVFVGTGDFPYLLNCRNFSFHIGNTVVSTNSVICGSNPVNFLATNSHSTYPGTYSWTPGPGTGFNYTATSASAVSCAFSFTLPPGYGKCTLLSDTINVLSQSIPSVIFNATVSAINCAGTPVSISANITPATTTYTWSTGTSTPVIVVTPTTTTTYSLLLDNGGCQSTATYSVNVNPNPTVNITAPTTSICTGNNLQLTATGATSYTWYPTLSTSTLITVNPSATTVYSLVGSDSFGCKDTTSTTITVSSPPILSVIPSKPLICFPDTVKLTASGASSYTWSTGATTSTISVLVFANTNYSVTGSNGCIVTKNYSLTGVPRPNVTITPSKPTVCNGDTVTLVASGAASYTWTTIQFVNPIVVSPTAPTTYSVLGLSTNGCYNYAGTLINIGNASVSIVSGSGELCIGKEIAISAIGATSYTWNTGATTPSFVFTPTSTSPVTFTVDATDASGCKTSATQTFVVSDKCQLIVYNGVTPNNDGNNDFFRIENIEQYPGNVVMIFNRWGMQLAEITDYNNSNNYWSGNTIGDKLAPSGTYFYVIDLKNGSSLLKGYIELTNKGF